MRRLMAVLVLLAVAFTTTACIVEEPGGHRDHRDHRCFFCWR